MPNLSTIVGNSIPYTISFRNKLINGNFDIWQRGTSLTSGTGARYQADRWVNDSAGSTYTVALQNFTIGQTDVPNEPSYFHRTVVTSVAGAGNYALLAQRVENVRTLANKKATLSFWAKANTNRTIAVEFSQSFGTGGSPSAQVTCKVEKINLTASWQKFIITADILGLSGKVTGSDNNDCLSINFWYDAGSNFNTRTSSLGQQSGTYDIAQVQLEEGVVATPFEQRFMGLELQLCQRYYEICRFEPVGICYKPNGDTRGGYNFKVTKRRIPTMDPNPIGISVLGFSYLGEGANLNGSLDLSPHTEGFYFSIMGNVTNIGIAAGNGNVFAFGDFARETAANAEI